MILSLPTVPVDGLFNRFLYAVIQGGEEVAANALLQLVDRACIVAQLMVLPIIVHHKGNGRKAVGGVYQQGLEEKVDQSQTLYKTTSEQISFHHINNIILNDRRN